MDEGNGDREDDVMQMSGEWLWRPAGLCEQVIVASLFDDALGRQKPIVRVSRHRRDHVQRV